MRAAGQIHLLERDYYLQFGQLLDVWPPSNLDLLDLPDDGDGLRPKSGTWMGGPWNREAPSDPKGGYLWRKLERHPRETERPHRQDTQIHETILRFPSAPLFGSQNKVGYQVDLKPVHQHTLRLFTTERPGTKPIKKIFLFFNGLNEIDRFDFYYDLASMLIDKSPDGDIACLVPPFPAHLTRYPLIGKYAEKPLQRFIADPSDLFRQYLRFMVEMQWLVSALVPVSYYPVPTGGAPLLKEDHQNPRGGRCDSKALSGAIHESWLKIHQLAGQRRGREIAEEEVHQAVSVLRLVVGWNPSATRLADQTANAPLDSPQLHVIGYSLGGYMAQSVFFTWPFAIGSCTTLCSGGALLDLRPEKILHEEEWRVITHALKYEVESGFLEGRIATDKSKQYVCGIPVSYFASHFQIFNDIFLQDPHGSYRNRVTEFAPRLFFVLGGNDPIVATRSVLDTSPAGGINMMEVANLSHFIGREKGEWPTFWLPTIAGIISSLSDHSEILLRRSMLNNLWNDDTSDRAVGTWLTATNHCGHSRGRLKDREPEPLDSEAIQDAIMRLACDTRDKNSFLLVLRNQLPVTFMGEGVLHRRGTVPHYGDYEIRSYWERLQQQRLTLAEAAARVTIVIPAKLKDWFASRQAALSDKHLPVVQEAQNEALQREIWRSFLANWEAKNGALYRFNPQFPTDITTGDQFRLERAIRLDTATPRHGWVINCLPDAWVLLSEKAMHGLTGQKQPRTKDIADLIEWGYRLYSGRKRRDNGEAASAEEKEALDNFGTWFRNEMEFIRISPVQSSPRYLGERILQPATAMDLIIHAALALARSQPCLAVGDFEKA